MEKEKLIKRCNEELLLKEIVEFMHRFSNPILIFGSSVYSLKNAKDVDLLIIGKFKKEELKKLEEKLNIRFHVINVKNLKMINEALKKEIKRKHLIINGSEVFIKWLIS